MKANLNDYVKVKLTKLGRDMYYVHGDCSSEVVNGYLKIQFWQLMNIFGKAMWNGNPRKPFETMEIEIERVT